MASDSDPCSLCGEPFGEEDLIGFTYVGSAHPLVRRVDDWAVHRRCLENFPQRAELVRAWNAEAARCLGRPWLLKVARGGRVGRLSWWDWRLFRLGFRSRLAR